MVCVFLCVPSMYVCVCVCSNRGGKDFFVIIMDKLMFVKGTAKHWCKYPAIFVLTCAFVPVVNFDLATTRHSMHEPCVLLPEIDGVRILTNSKCEFMHRVTCEFAAACLQAHMIPSPLSSSLTSPPDPSSFYPLQLLLSLC